MIVKGLNRKLGLLKKTHRLFSQVPAEKEFTQPQ